MLLYKVIASDMQPQLKMHVHYLSPSAQHVCRSGVKLRVHDTKVVLWTYAWTCCAWGLACCLHLFKVISFFYMGYACDV